MRRVIPMARLISVALLAAALVAPRPAAAAETVDLLLVFAADVSRSIDQEKFQLQRDGYAAAITNPRVLDAVRSGPHHRIAVCFVEWSGIGAQKLLIDWTIIKDGASAQQFAAQLAEANHARFAITSKVNDGTLVEVAFPVAAAHVPAK